jgi:hypothetical protein
MTSEGARAYNGVLLPPSGVHGLRPWLGVGTQEEEVPLKLNAFYVCKIVFLHLLHLSTNTTLFSQLRGHPFFTSAPGGEVQSTVDACGQEEGVLHAGVDVHSQVQKLKTECTL